MDAHSPTAAEPQDSRATAKLATSIRDVTKDYVLKSETVRALRGVSFDAVSYTHLTLPTILLV